MLKRGVEGQQQIFARHTDRIDIESSRKSERRRGDLGRERLSVETHEIGRTHTQWSGELDSGIERDECISRAGSMIGVKIDSGGDVADEDGLDGAAEVVFSQSFVSEHGPVESDADIVRELQSCRLAEAGGLCHRQGEKYDLRYQRESRYSGLLRRTRPPGPGRRGRVRLFQPILASERLVFHGQSEPLQTFCPICTPPETCPPELLRSTFML